MIVNLNWIDSRLQVKKKTLEIDYPVGGEKNPISADKNTKKQPPSSSSDTDSEATTSDEDRAQTKHIHAGISGALKDNKIIKLGPGWIAKSLLTPAPIPVSATANTKKDVPHVLVSTGRNPYYITLSRCNISEQETTNRVIDLQVYIDFTFPSRSVADCSCMPLMKSDCGTDCKI